MKFLLQIIVFHLAIILPAAGQVMFHENFEVPDSVFSQASGASGWHQNNRIQSDGNFCDSVYVMPGDTLSLTTIPFSTVGYNGIYLSFDHICKVEFFDYCMIDVSPDSGVTWFRLCDEYLSNSLFQTQSCRFTEANYISWVPGQVAVPLNSWWEREDFDLTGLLFNKDNAMIRFTYKDMNANGSGFNAGWYLDNIRVTEFVEGPKVTGKLYYDLNSNAVQDPGEASVNSMMVTDTVTATTGLMFMGDYTLPFISPSAYYAVSGTLNNFVTTPLSHAGNLTAFSQIDSLRDFAFQPIGSFNDLVITVTPITPFRPGMNTTVLIDYHNTGTNMLSPVITFMDDGYVSYNSASQIPIFVSPDSVVWNPAALLPSQSGQIILTLSVSPAAIVGDITGGSAIITPIAGDSNPSDNQSAYGRFIISSFDPNEIHVNRDSVFDFELGNPPFLKYDIRFQNTGNDTAFHVQILNQVSSDLDITTFEFITSSHQVQVSYHDQLRLLVFDFPNINLPDSGTNQLNSHGTISYLIKPLTTLNPGDSILNAADIYFDYNAPVTTNTAVTEIVLPTGIENAAGTNKEDVTVYPNPVSGEFNLLLEGMKNEKVRIELFDVMGKQVTLFEGIVTSDKLQVTSDLGGLPNGIYIIRTNSSVGSVQNRIVKM